MPRRVRVRRREKIKLIFRGDMCGTKNTSRPAQCASGAVAGFGRKRAAFSPVIRLLNQSPGSFHPWRIPGPDNIRL